MIYSAVRKTPLVNQGIGAWCNAFCLKNSEVNRILFHRRIQKPFDSRVCVLFDAYRLDFFTLASYRSLQVKLASVCDVFFVYHDTAGIKSHFPSNTLILNDERIFRKFLNKKSRESKIIPGNCDLKTLAAIEEIGSYDRYISVEFDVICIKNVAETFSRLIEATKTVDFGGSYMETKEQQPNWMWWSSLEPPAGVQFNPDHLKRSFLPLSVYSQRYMELYRQELQAGWAGHQEVLLPTLAQKNAMTTVVLNQKSLNFTAWPPFGAGTPSGLESQSLPAFLHSIKNIEEHNALPKAVRRCSHLNDLLENFI